jgi:cobalt-zinc-cadmium efflux system outer membrane protein
LKNNAGLLADKAEIAIAEARLLTARLRPNPVATVSGDHLPVLGTRFTEENGGGPAEIVAGIEFTIERGGKRPARVAAAEVAKTAAELRFENAVRELTLEVATAFIDAMAARDAVELTRENLGFLRQIAELNAIRLKVGDIAEVELVRSRLAALQQETVVRQAELKLRDALIRLQKLMGRRPPASDFRVAGALDRADYAPRAEDLLKEALERRPDLLAKRREVERAAADVRLQLAGARQNWTLGTEFRRQQVNAKANSLTVTLGVPLPVFDRNQGEIERARQEQRQTELALRALEVDIAAEVSSAHAQLLAARDLLHTAGGAMLQHAREVRQITEFAYRRGESNLMALLDAQRAFNETMQTLLEARAEYARSLLLLDSVCGRSLVR